jgi:hypothetical protein
MDLIVLNCPYCGEQVQLEIDASGGTHQTFVEDCPICCRPWDVEVLYNDEDGWNATLRKADE